MKAKITINDTTLIAKHGYPTVEIKGIVGTLGPKGDSYILTEQDKQDIAQLVPAGSGTGDMLRATYDVNNDGVVDNSETLEGHPASYFAQASHEHSKDDIIGLLNYVCPVGIILNFANDVDPNTIYFGTTWEKISGVFLYSADNSITAGATGGEASHKLLPNELPSGHFSSFSWHDPTSSGPFRVQSTLSNRAMTPDGNSMGPMAYAFGGDQPHNNMPPYLAVNTWKRTA